MRYKRGSLCVFKGWYGGKGVSVTGRGDSVLLPLPDFGDPLGGDLWDGMTICSGCYSPNITFGGSAVLEVASYKASSAGLSSRFFSSPFGFSDLLVTLLVYAVNSVILSELEDRLSHSALSLAHSAFRRFSHLAHRRLWRLSFLFLIYLFIIFTLFWVP